jgi:hypothetical protein
VNDFDNVSRLNAMIAVSRTSNDFSIDFDRDGPLGKPEVGDQGLHR